ncbi:hypothetical protein [Dongia deserti]|uniref:hypothetical protein n=1 Tax=Dongia deserti TaxID=2268030 RepID=UPI0013C48335|nr:hypothetical protein [Dongia deserti]
MSRTPRHRLLAGVGAAIALAGLPLFAFAEAEISARGWTHDRFGRLVFDRAARLATSAEIKDQKLIITFSEPVSVDLSGALRFLNTYVEGPKTAQGRRIELDLAQPVTLYQWIEEGKFVLDLRPTDASSAEGFQTGAGTAASEAPTAEAPKAEAPKTEAPPAQEPGIIKPGVGKTGPAATSTGLPPKIIARHGDHGTFVRLAIDWPSRIGYRVIREGDRIEVAFTAPADIDLARARKTLPTELAQIAAVNDNVARIYLTLASGASLRDFRLGRTVVLDIMRPVKQAGAAPALRLPETGSEGEQAAAVPSLPAAPEPAPETPKSPGAIAVPPVAEAPAAQPPRQQPLAESPAPPSLAEPPQAEPSPQFALRTLPAMPEAAPQPEPAPAAQTGQTSQAAEATQPAPPPMPAIEQATLPPRAPVDVQIRVAPTENGTKIMFAWPQAVAAAAFRRNGALWLAFDMPSNDVKNLFEDARVARLGKTSKLDIPDVTIIRIAETSPLGVSMTASGKSWIVDLTPGGKHAPTQTIEQRRESLADGASSFLLQTNGPGRVASVTDPAGGNIHIVPVRPSGLGIGEQVSWPEFQLLPSYQGVVIASIGDSITVDSLPQGVVITTKPQVALEPIAQTPAKGEEAQVASREQEAEPQAAAKPQAPKEGESILASVPGLFDLPTWRRGGEATFRADQRGLQEAVTDASEADEAVARMALGEFYFAHGLVEEADSALAQIGREGRSRLDQRRLALLVGAIQTLDGQLEKARATLADKSLTGVAEANLFQGLLAAREEKWEEAARHLADPLPNVADYPKPIRETIYLSAGEALNNAGNPIAARRFADALRQDQPDRKARDRLAYLDGQIKLKAGDRDEALQLWARLADSSVEDIKARSQFDLVEERLKGGELTPAEAIRPLEALRFVNRGGQFEFKLLRKLGTLYLGENQPRKGLVALRQAAANFPKQQEAKEVGEQMSAAFRELYLEDGADRLSPLTAVALYDEFRELTPAGADGDRMMSLLADRLVNVDLLGRAAELLDTLVQKRLTGLDKVHAGTRLAAIRMLDHKPELALKALKDSKVDDVLPPDMAAERKRLEARATFDTGDTLGGLQMLLGDDSLEAKWLRADMQWRTREWSAAADALGELIAGEEQVMADERAALKDAMDPSKNPAASVRSAEAEAELKAKQEQHFNERVAPLLLNRVVALSLASDRRGLKALANQYGKRMEGTGQGKAFAMLTAADNGLLESVSAEMAGVNRIDAFVTDYRKRLKKASLSAEANHSGS